MPRTSKLLMFGAVFSRLFFRLPVEIHGSYTLSSPVVRTLGKQA